MKVNEFVENGRLSSDIFWTHVSWKISLNAFDIWIEVIEVGVETCIWKKLPRCGKGESKA